FRPLPDIAYVRDAHAYENLVFFVRTKRARERAPVLRGEGTGALGLIEGERSALDVAGAVLQRLGGVGVVLTELVDADGGDGRVTGVVELDRTAHAVVVDVLAGLEQLDTGREAIALLAALADLGQLGSDVLARVALGGLGGQRDEVGGVVRLRRVGEVLEVLVHLEELLLEVVRSRGAGEGSLDALHRALGGADVVL